jgi:hypothetical protein
MEKTIKYSVSKTWLQRLLGLGIVLVLIGTVAILNQGTKYIYFANILIGFGFIFQNISFSKNGYFIINEKELIFNHGLRKSMIPISELKQVTRKQNSIQLLKKDGQKKALGLSFIAPELRDEVFENLEKICPKSHE